MFEKKEVTKGGRVRGMLVCLMEVSKRQITLSIELSYCDSCGTARTDTLTD